MSTPDEWQAEYDLLRAEENRLALKARDRLLGGHPTEAVLAARESVGYSQQADAMLQQLREQRGGK